MVFTTTAGRCTWISAAIAVRESADTVRATSGNAAASRAVSRPTGTGVTAVPASADTIARPVRPVAPRIQTSMPCSPADR